jgi:exonuclease VII small subunit
MTSPLSTEASSTSSSPLMLHGMYVRGCFKSFFPSHWTREELLSNLKIYLREAQPDTILNTDDTMFFWYQVNENILIRIIFVKEGNVWRIATIYPMTRADHENELEKKALKQEREAVAQRESVKRNYERQIAKLEKAITKLQGKLHEATSERTIDVISKRITEYEKNLDEVRSSLTAFEIGILHLNQSAGSKRERDGESSDSIGQAPEGVHRQYHKSDELGHLLGGDAATAAAAASVLHTSSDEPKDKRRRREYPGSSKKRESEDEDDGSDYTTDGDDDDQTRRRFMFTADETGNISGGAADGSWGFGTGRASAAEADRDLTHGGSRRSREEEEFSASSPAAAPGARKQDTKRRRRSWCNCNFYESIFLR